MGTTPVKIGFVLLSNSLQPTPSTRIAVLNMFAYLRAANFEPHIVFDPVNDSASPDVSGLASRVIAEQFEIVCFQKVGGQSVLAAAAQLKRVGIKTAFIVCDVVDIAMVEATDVTIAVAEFLRSAYPPALQWKIHVVHDGIEAPDRFKVEWSEHAGSLLQPLRAVLVTSANIARVPVLRNPPHWLRIIIVGRYPPVSDRLQRLREVWWELHRRRDLPGRLAYLRFLAHARVQLRAWDPIGVYETMLRADLAIIPVDPPARPPAVSPASWQLKSENRLTMKMGVGLPVIASPVPSYEQVIDQGRNGFLARSKNEWIEYLDALREPALRRIIGQQARVSVLNRFSMAEQGRLLVSVLRGLIPV